MGNSMLVPARYIDTMAKYIRNASTYFIAAAFIITWWAIAFNFTLPSQSPSFKHRPFQSLATFTPIDRHTLHKALSGDIALMAKLISDWDLDAQLLKRAGYPHAMQLARPLYLRSQIIARQSKLIENQPSPRVLPQTHAAASFALALTDAEQLVALPSGLRKLSHLFSSSITDKIPLDIDHYNAEMLFLAQPQIAFVAHYSHPSIIHTLEAQNVQLVYLNGINDLPQIKNSLEKVGAILNRAPEAELLSIFMDAAMIAIDNCLLPFKDAIHQMDTLFLYHHHQFAIPTHRTLTGQLLERIGVQHAKCSLCAEDWLIPISREQLASLNPRCLIIATEDADTLLKTLWNDPALVNVAAFKEGSLFFVDESVQQFPSQYVVLAYFDIVQAIVSSLNPM